MPRKMTNLEKIKSNFKNIDENTQLELSEILDYYDENNFSTQTLYKNIFPAFIEADLSGDLLERTKNIRKLGLSITKEKHILMRGEKLGTTRWESYVNFQSLKNTKEYKKEKYGWTDDEFSEYNRSRSVTLENCVKRHGKELGEQIFENYREKQRNNGCSLSWFQDKFGREEGKIYFENMNAKKANTLDIFILRYGKEDGERRYFEYVDSVQGRGKLSKSSQSLFWELDEYFSETSYFGEKNKEFGKYDVDYKRYYYYDFVIPELKVVVEFNGDDWHANPEIYENKKWNHPFNMNISKEEIWEYDKIKRERIEADGFKVFYIWEKVYLKDKRVQLNKLKDEINDYTKRN